MAKPQPEEFESTYIKYYIDLVQGDDIAKTLEAQLASTQKFVKMLSEDQGNYAYADGKWSLKEVLGHMSDTERIMAYRALCISRNEQQSMLPFEENDYVREASFNKRSLADIANEFRLVRESNLALFKSFDESVMDRTGLSSGKKISVRSLMYLIAGHEIHHLNVIRTKYLS